MTQPASGFQREATTSSAPPPTDRLNQHRSLIRFFVPQQNKAVVGRNGRKPVGQAVGFRRGQFHGPPTTTSRRPPKKGRVLTADRMAPPSCRFRQKDPTPSRTGSFPRNSFLSRARASSFVRVSGPPRKVDPMKNAFGPSLESVRKETARTNATSVRRRGGHARFGRRGGSRRKSVFGRGPARVDSGTLCSLAPVTDPNPFHGSFHDVAGKRSHTCNRASSSVMPPG
jgi:hypothetical protein